MLIVKLLVMRSKAIQLFRSYEVTQQKYHLYSIIYKTVRLAEKRHRASVCSIFCDNFVQNNLQFQKHRVAQK
jgi:hypothetical protein